MSSLSAGHEVTFITFGDGRSRMRRAAERLSTEAKKSGCFREVISENYCSISVKHSDFVKTHSSLLRPMVKGFGYWVWKPLIIADSLRKCGKYLLYLDAGCILNLDSDRPVRRLEDYLAIAKERNGMLMQIPLKERDWTKMDLAVRLNLSEDHFNSGQLQAGIVLLKRCSSTIDLVDNWLRIAVENNYHFLDDSPSFLRESESFLEHRHDQSILSGLAKKAGIGFLSDETYFAPNWHQDGHQFPFWAARYLYGTPHSMGKYHQFRINSERLLDRFEIAGLRFNEWRNG